MPVSNFRDFGGYASHLGGHVVRDKLYRSALIADASEDARASLEGYDFELIVDLRYRAEQEHQPSNWPEYFTNRQLFHGSDRESEAPHLAILNSKTTDPNVVDLYFNDYYRALPFDKLYRPLYSEILRRLAGLEGRMLVHCTAGKDRTGVIVALIHTILGVDADDIMNDFMLSARLPGLEDQVASYVEPVSEQYGYAVPFELLNRLMRVQESYLHTAFRTIEEKAGSIDAYLDEMDVGPDVRDRLRARLLVTAE